MAGHEIEQYDLAPEAEVLPYGAREFAQDIGHQAVSGGDVIIEQHNGGGSESSPARQPEQTQDSGMRTPHGIHRYMMPRVVPVQQPTIAAPRVW